MTSHRTRRLVIVLPAFGLVLAAAAPAPYPASPHPISPGADDRAPAAASVCPTFIAGIRGVTTANADAIAVMIDSAGQLGTVSSSRATKRDIEDLRDRSARLLALRPVSFRYREHPPDAPIQYGLIAEEVAEVFPELVVRDDVGRPQTVRYHLLSTLLLDELQRQAERIERIERLLGLEVPDSGVPPS